MCDDYNDLSVVDVTIQSPGIRLDQFLKLANAVAGGGEAKLRIQAGEAAVNGGEELRRGRKLAIGDLVQFAGHKYRVTPAAKP